MNKIFSRAPLRIGLAGGGTDVAPYCDEYGGYVLNSTIDRYAYATIEPISAGQPVFRAADLDTEEPFAEDFSESPLRLHHATYQYMIEKFNAGQHVPMRMTTFCDAPVGSGLGTSSTLVVAMIKALTFYFRVELTQNELSKTAYHIERVICGLRGGRQDQYSASFGGFNFMEFYEGERALVNPLRILRKYILHLEAHLLLCFSGISRDSGQIITKQSEGVEKKASQSLDSLHRIKKEAVVMKEGLLHGDFDLIVESLKEGWAAKKSSASAVSNSHTDEIYDFALQNGARAGKLSGAGGGGFFLFYVDADKRADLSRALQERELQISNVHFTKYGAEAWHI